MADKDINVSFYNFEKMRIINCKTSAIKRKKYYVIIKILLIKNRFKFCADLKTTIKFINYCEGKDRFFWLKSFF